MCTDTMHARMCVSAVVCVVRKPRPCPGTVIIVYIGVAHTAGGDTCVPFAHAVLLWLGQ